MIRLFHGRFCISSFTAVLFLILSLSADAAFFFIAAGCAVLHELGHIGAMRYFGIRDLRITAYPFGAEISADTSGLSYGAEVVCAIAGPAVSLILAVALEAVLIIFPNVYVLSAVVSSFLFFAVNILPVRSLDGGRALIALLLMRLEFARAYRIYSYVSTAAFGVLCFFALVLLWASGYNLSLIFICTYLFISEYVRTKCC